MTPESDYPIEPFFRLSHDLFCIAGFDGYFRRINPAVSQVLGYSEEELFSRPISDFIYEDDREITAQLRYQLTQNKPLLNFENRYVSKSGELVWLSWTSIPQPQEQLVYAIAKNITHKKKLEEQRNIHLEELTRINEDLKQFSYATSHNLRSPVNNLMSLIDLLEMASMNADPSIFEATGFITVLRESVNSLKQALDTSVDKLADAGRSGISMDDVDIAGCLSSVLRSIHSLINSSGAAIHTDFSAFTQLRFNRGFLESIFLNLVSNSIKYAQPGRTPDISICSEIHNGRKRLVITDNGQGFDLEQVGERVFGFNQSFHGHDDSKGIGLYLVQHHMNSLGGQVALKSSPGQGSEFTLTFSASS